MSGEAGLAGGAAGAPLTPTCGGGVRGVPLSPGGGAGGAEGETARAAGERLGGNGAPGVTQAASHEGAGPWWDPVASRAMGRWRQVPDELLRRARELRRRQTSSEELLWACLRGSRLGGVKFRRQHNVGRYILDFFAFEPRLGIEVDGPIHQLRRERDAARTRELEALGLRIIRFTNDQVQEDLPAVLSAILQAASDRSLRSPSPRGEGHPTHPSAASGGEGLPPPPLANADQAEERNEIEGRLR
jgi:very-short-patch-repair endonuclease